MTGKRGPIDGATFGAPRGRPKGARKPKPAALVAFQRSDDAGMVTPSDLGPAGLQIWREIAADLPVLHPTLDRAALHRLADLHDERQRYSESLHLLGVVLVEPIVSPTGAVVGERVVLNPAEAALRRLDKQIDVISAAFGLTPAARARLGLQSAQIDRTRAVAATILAGARKESTC